MVLDLNYHQLILYGVHVGHSIKNTPLYSTWMVYAIRENLYLINLFKTLTFFKIGFRHLNDALSLFAPIWFVNLDVSMDRFIKYAARNCGEYSASTWIRGMLSNYGKIYNSYIFLRNLNSQAHRSKHIRFTSNLKHFYLTRFTWPRALFISNVSLSYFAVAEALLIGIPCLGVVDTNSSSMTVSVPIPGNDESLDCLIFYNDLISHYIIWKKLGSVVAWYNNIRRSRRLLFFNKWLYDHTLNNNFKKLKIKNLQKKSFLFKYRPNMYMYNYKGLSFFFSKNFYLSRFFDRLEIIYPLRKRYSILPKRKRFGYFLTKKSNYLLHLMSIVRLQRIFKFRRVISLSESSNVYFKLNFLYRDNTLRFLEDKWIRLFSDVKDLCSGSFFFQYYRFFYLSKYEKYRGYLSTLMTSNSYLNLVSFTIGLGYIPYKKDFFQKRFLKKIFLSQKIFCILTLFWYRNIFKNAVKI